MPVIIEYLQGYGWHMGRLALWPLLFVCGAALTFVLVVTGQLACAFFKWPGIYSFFPPFIVPLTFALIFRKRVQRKLGGEAFVVNLPEFLYPNTTAWLISRGHRNFRALLMIDALIWCSSILAQLGVAIAPMASAYTR